MSLLVDEVSTIRRARRIVNALVPVLEAIVDDEGPHPELHRKVMAKHREEWPTLWAALDGLWAAIEE